MQEAVDRVPAVVVGHRAYRLPRAAAAPPGQPDHGLDAGRHQGREPRQGRAREARHGLPQNSTRISKEYLRANGYSKSCDALAKEVGSGLEKLELADNVDLGSVIREFDAYYQLKLGRPPKLLRRRDNENEPPKPPGVYERRKRGAARAAAEKAERIERPREAGESVALGVLKSRLGVSGGEGNVPQKPMWLDNDGVTGSKIEPTDRNAIVNDNPNEHILKPPPAFADDSELQGWQCDSTGDYAPTAWRVMAGVKLSSRIRQSCVGRPWSCPRSTRCFVVNGLGACCCSGRGRKNTGDHGNTDEETFFNISASSIVSKYREIPRSW